MQKRKRYIRASIRLRIFITILFSTVFICLVSLGVFTWSLKQNFANYVTEVELQKLDHLTSNLAEIYQVYGSWPAAITNTTKNIHHSILAENQKELLNAWLRRQYDISIQQTKIIQHNNLYKMGVDGEDSDDITAKKDTFIPSHFEPFVEPDSTGKDKPIMTTKKTTQASYVDRLLQDLHHTNTVEDYALNETAADRRWLVPMPDKLGLAERLSLFDVDKKIVIGENNRDIPMKEIMLDGEVVGYIGLRPTLNQDDALSINFFANQQRYMIFVVAVALILSSLAAILLAKVFIRPIREWLKAAYELTEGNYQHRIKISDVDNEITDLSKKINHLAHVLEQHESARRNWVADTSHELKTPLSVLSAQIEAMQDGVRKPTPEHFERMMNQVMNLRRLTTDLADLAQADADKLMCSFSEITPWDIVVHEVDNFRTQFEQKQLKITMQGDGVKLISDPGRFRQVVVNLLGNSLRYTEDQGEIHIHSEVVDEQWLLFVDDSPLGLTDEQLQQLGQRFYRVDASRTRGTGGTGLGLALSTQIMQALGGYLQFDHSPLGGLRCKVALNIKFEETDLES